MSSARDEILERVRAHSSGSQPIDPRTPLRGRTVAPSDRAELFCARVADYRAEVIRTSEDAAGETVLNALRTHRAARIGIPRGLPTSWRPPGIELVTVDAVDATELDGLDGVVTGCTVAIADTGTIVLSSGPTEGPRALTLVPDFHVCVVLESQVVASLPDAIPVVRDLVAAGRRPLTFISGPSATSDIELERVEGVHGPRTLTVVVVGRESA